MEESSASQDQSCLKPENTRMVAISSAPNLRVFAASDGSASPQHLSSTQLSRKSTKPTVWGEDNQRVEGELLERQKLNASGRKRERLHSHDWDLRPRSPRTPRVPGRRLGSAGTPNHGPKRWRLLSGVRIGPGSPRGGHGLSLPTTSAGPTGLPGLLPRCSRRRWHVA